MMEPDISTSAFTSEGIRCVGTLYLPQAIDRPPVVVMGHGLAAQRDFHLEPFAKRFVERGLAVFTFDYRHWGESDGEPRHLLLPRRQLQDWRAALAHARGLQQVDGERLGIWGSSFGGAHVIHVAAEDHGIRAVVSQVLAADTLSAVRGFGPGYMVKSTTLALMDSLRGLLGLAPLYMPVVGRPGETAVLNTAECWEGYLGLVPEDSPWQNRIAARSVLHLPFYRAIKVAHRVTAPTLLMGGVDDSLVAIEDIRSLAGRLPGAELREYPCNHFAPYYPPMFETFVAAQGEFLASHLEA